MSTQDSYVREPGFRTRMKLRERLAQEAQEAVRLLLVTSCSGTTNDAAG